MNFTFPKFALQTTIWFKVCPLLIFILAQVNYVKKMSDSGKSTTNPLKRCISTALAGFCFLMEGVQWLLEFSLQNHVLY